MVEHRPVQNSEVYLLGLAPRPSIPPPSPPSPLTPTETGASTPIEQLCLDSTEIAAPSSDQELSFVAKRRINGAIHVLNTEATALRNLTRLYKHDATAAEGFDAAVGAIVWQCRERGKLVVTGVGKSGHIGKKLVATFNSLGLPSTFLHPTEALHGDLGMVGKHDAVMFITFSGQTAELLALLPHVDPVLPVIVLTSHSRPVDCELIRRRPGAILLPAPIHESETASFGVSAPTTSTTVALALGDALAVVVSQELHISVPSVFARNHPGGAIGAAFENNKNKKKPCTMSDIAVAMADIPSLPPTSEQHHHHHLLCGADVLKAGYGSPSGWVALGKEALACPTRIRRLETSQLASSLADIPDLVVPRSEWICIGADTRVCQAARWIQGLAASSSASYPPDNYSERRAACGEESIVAVLDVDGDGTGAVIGVLEAGELLRWREGI
ncbi:SIS domain-containing protein [Xylariaceae sp. FL0594]|nr:SIS domain-containing protein [Xylariaceae sp. FL0594]